MHSVVRNAIVTVATLGASLAGAHVTPICPIQIEGTVLGADDISAIAYTAGFLVVGADEKASIQVLPRNVTVEAPVYAAGRVIQLFAAKREMDIEGIARVGSTYYVAGSHSKKRRQAKMVDDGDTLTQEDNRKRFRKGVKEEEERNRVYRLDIVSSDGGGLNLQAVNLVEVIGRDPVLGPFAQIPSKENGVDIEGIAVDGDSLYLGFRGPVLRGNFSPVMVLRFDDVLGAENLEEFENYRLRYVNLGGRGIRDITKVNGGFLIIGGPVGDMGSYELYFWTGLDDITGVENPEGQITRLGEIPVPDGAKAEGIAVKEETGTEYEIIVVYDGAESGAPTLFRVHKPECLRDWHRESCQK